MNHDKIYKDIDEVLTAAKKAEGKTVEQININHRSLEGKNKGIIGQIVEEGVFGYANNSRAEPDFSELGVELKVTGIKQNKNKTFSAKERLVLNMIDYFKEANKDFFDSSFWQKNQHLLLMFYLYDADKDIKDFKFIESILYDFPKKDLEIIKQDYEIIQKKIKAGKAHLISESDTIYLTACPKGANASSLKNQPYSDIKAMARAYALKASYISHIFHSNNLDSKAESLVSYEELMSDTFEMVLMKRAAKYIGQSEKDLCEKFQINMNQKAVFERISSNIMGIKGKLNNCDEIIKANIVAKSVRIDKKKNGDNKIIESMSLPAFKFTEIVKEDWDDSELRNYFSDRRFMFFVFENVDGEYIFKGLKFWNISESLLDTTIKDVWQRTVDIINSGDIIANYKTEKGNKVIRLNNFPKMKDNGICHVRPHGQNAKDTYPLPVAEIHTGAKEYTKQCFWLNNSFVLKKLGY